MAEDEKDKAPDWFEESQARIHELEDLRGQMRDGDGLEMKERLHRLKEIQGRSRDSRPTAKDRESLLERLRQQHGDLPKKTLLQKAMGEVVANLGYTLEEIRCPSAQDLHGAIIVGDIAEVRRLIAAGIDITARGATGDSPLGAATLHRQPEIDAVDNLGFSALTAPVLEQRDEVIALLKARGAKPRMRFLFPANEDDDTPP